jgi:tetratricopeptide (TPR) repeat protein
VNYREFGNYYEEQEVNEAVQRYEKMLREGATKYFDVIQIEQIIERYIEEGKIHPALEAIQMGMAQHPGSIALKIRKVNILFNLGEIAQALKLANELLKIEDTNPELHLMKGSAHLLLGNPEEANRAFNLSLKYSPDDRDEALFNIAYAYEQSNDYKRAIKYLEEAILINPQHEGALYELAYCLERTDQDEQSLELYNRYIDADTFSDSAWFNLGIVLTKLNRLEESVEAYDYALVINEDFPNAWFNMGHSLMLLKKFNEAIEAFNNYLKYDEQNDEVLTLIANCYTRLRQSDAAILHYQQAINSNEKNDRAWFGYALELYGSKKYRKAYECMLKATKYNDIIFDYQYFLAKTASKLNYLNSAVDAFEKTLGIDQFKKSVWLSYANMLFKKGMVIKAIEILETALVHFPEHALILYRLAAYYLDINDTETAEIYLDNAVRTDKKNTQFLFKAYPEAAGFELVHRIIAKYNK